jgi:hypothetical protein
MPPEEDSRPALLIEPVREAARSALQPDGPLRWSIESRADCVELRAVVRRWCTAAADPTAQLARVAGGAALRAARLAVAVQGRHPLVSYPEQPGVLAVLYAGLPAAPRRSDMLLHRLLRHEVVPAWYRARLLDPPTALRRLRCAVEGEGAWMQVLDGSPPADLGPHWQDADGQAPDADRRTVVALVGAPGRLPVADLRVGQALETLRLTAMVLGLEMDVLAAPARPIAGMPRRVGSGTETLAVVRVGWPPAEVHVGQDEGHRVDGASDAAALPAGGRVSS